MSSEKHTPKNSANNTINSQLPYIVAQITTEIRLYNPDFGDDRICKCGHPYYRHFDGYQPPHEQDVGCKYCRCATFVERKRKTM